MKLIERLSKWWKKQWEVIPPQTSDTVSVAIVRKDSNGRLIRFSLDGEDAKQWGWLMLNCSRIRNPREDEGKNWKQLDWKKEYITLT